MPKLLLGFILSLIIASYGNAQSQDVPLIAPTIRFPAGILLGSPSSSGQGPTESAQPVAIAGLNKQV